MARAWVKYGSGVAGLPFLLRVVVTAVVVGPSAFWLLASLALARSASPWTALSLALAVLFAMPAYLVLPALWERTTESVRSDWRAHDLERRLDLALRVVEEGPVESLHQRAAPPRRW